MCLDKWLGIVFKKKKKIVNFNFQKKKKMIFQKWFFKNDSIKQAPFNLPRYPCPYQIAK